MTVMWAKQCHLHHPRVISIFIGGIYFKPFLVMAGLWHLFCRHKTIMDFNTVARRQFRKQRRVPGQVLRVNWKRSCRLPKSWWSTRTLDLALLDLVQKKHYWLVVWNMNFMIFHILGIIIPINFHIVSEGLKPATRLDSISDQWIDYDDLLDSISL